MGLPGYDLNSFREKRGWSTISCHRDFTVLDYLKSGTERQREAYDAIRASGVFDLLAAYGPILAGTIPLDIDIEGSDLDIICTVYHYEEFAASVAKHFSHFPGFVIHHKEIGNRLAVIGRFRFAGFLFEIFGQSLPAVEQNAYLHMLAEYHLLCAADDAAKDAIRSLKRQGVKTEPAFAQYFGLAGDPYQTLSELARNSELAITKEYQDCGGTIMNQTVPREIGELYQQFIQAWNDRNAAAMSALFADDGEMIGFDGSNVIGRDQILSHLEPIFASHPTPPYITKVKGIHILGSDAAILRAIAGMVPPGKTDLVPDLNCQQTVVAVQKGSEWSIALFQNTPAQFHGRPDLAAEMTAELKQVLADGTHAQS